MMYKIRSVPFDGKYMTSSLMAIVIFVLSVTIWEIFTKQEKFQNFSLENEAQDQGAEERDLRHSAGNVRLHIDEFLQNFSYVATWVTQKVDTRTARDRGADCRKNLHPQSRFA